MFFLKDTIKVYAKYLNLDEDEIIDKFNDFYNCGYFDRVYATNLAYVPEEAKSQPWFKTIDCSRNIAFIINELNYGRSIGEVIKGRDAVLKRVREIREKRGNRDNEIK